ncbi:single-stranded DNA-binding protein [Tenggerimyces flavus]|uniref:Single-stranded DNA-binding protein n=1 Tax=Tenggerimyces flavus TaxID=1708749 RepID=A0ABV7YGQ5_9ACTN|nr:hypothetical protein [Tenggerimyces flavus]MBM7789855.1 single-strand DNA-binding protein [Tenggerimyces flavus]
MSLQNESPFSAAGWVAGEVRYGMSEDQRRPWAAFRFVWTERRFDKERGTYVDFGGGNFVTVWCNWELARHVTSSLHKGDPVLVVGRLRVEEKEINARKYGEAEVSAYAVGHNLSWGTSAFRRVRVARSTASESPPWDRTTEAAPEPAADEQPEAA